MTVATKRSLAAQVFLQALLCLELLGLSASSEDLFARRFADQIHVLAPRLHFLTGKSLERLKDGATVPFDFQLSIAAGFKNNFIGHPAVERFSVSYDVWEEKFRVVRLRDFRKSAAGLSALAAESWCLENLLVPAAGLPADKELWARLDIRTAEPRDPVPSTADSGISIPALIQLLSRPPHPQQDHWTLESAAFHLADLRQ
ncbi:MAG TPA: hypothetical protein VGP62_16405 [Bryobacteraceae bacterium]|nr:hypothetical protein [Bryobacteraceae bacterium]